MAKESKYTPDITQRFLLLMDEVIAQGQGGVKNRTDFAGRVGEYRTNLTKMEQGTRAPTLDQCAAACLEFGYSANWLLLNLGPKKLDKKSLVPVETQLSNLELRLRRVEKQLQQAFSKETTG